MMRWAELKEALSSVVLRCGPSLTSFVSSVPMSDAAINHLLQLPHLRTWSTRDPPPTYSVSTLPPAFPPLVRFTLWDGVARGWLSLFKRLEDRAPTTQGPTSLSKVRESLKYLSIENHRGTVTDISLTSIIQGFRNLVYLHVNAYCNDTENGGKCTFKLNNDNVTELAMALPRLECLCLGRPCPGNTCATTVACLLPISVHCTKLARLEVHLNTTNIVDDLKEILEGPRFQKLRSLPRCTLPCLDVWRTPLTSDESGFGIMANGIIDIFPSLELCRGLDQTWSELSVRIRGCKCS